MIKLSLPQFILAMINQTKHLEILPNIKRFTILAVTQTLPRKQILHAEFIF